jgi:hypothetical protein
MLTWIRLKDDFYQSLERGPLAPKRATGNGQQATHFFDTHSNSLVLKSFRSETRNWQPTKLKQLHLY